MNPLSRTQTAVALALALGLTLGPAAAQEPETAPATAEQPAEAPAAEPEAQPAEAEQTAEPAETAAGEAAAPAEAGAEEDPLVATVDGEEIHRSEVMGAVDRLPPQLRQMPIEMLVPILADQLATGRLLAARAYEDNLQDDPEVRARLEEAERAIVADIWLQRAIDERLTDEAVEQGYQDLLAANPPQEEVRARHILVQSEEEARDIIDQLNAGADFATLAQEHSADAGSGAQGGDLGFFRRGDMVEPFEEAAFALQPGEVTEEPVESQFGWHVIQVEERRTSEPPPLDAIRDDLRAQLSQDVVRSIVDELRADADIVLYGPDGQPLMPPSEDPAAASPQ